MNWAKTSVTQALGLEFPIIQGPFGGGLSSVALTAAVSEAGGLGSFGAHHLTADEIRALAANIRAKTAKPFAINLWIPFENSDNPQPNKAEFQSYLAPLHTFYTELGLSTPEQPQRFMPTFDDQINAVLEVKPAVFSFVYGIPSAEIIGACRQRGITTLGTATTPDEAIALEKAGIDMIVATGFEAGGHRVSFLRPAEDSLTGSFALIPQVADAVKIPVIAAGGIADGRGIAAALSLGADAVQIGTAFLACAESAAAAVHKEKLFSEDARFTVLTRAFSGRLARGIRNRFSEEVRQYAPYPIQGWLTGKIKAAAIQQGRADLFSLWASQASPLLKHKNAAILFKHLVEETSARLGVASASGAGR